MVAAFQAAIYHMTLNDLYACWALDQRCFEDGEAYDLSTFRMLLSSQDCISYKVVDSHGEMKAFLVGMVDRNTAHVKSGSGHIIAVGVAPEARQQGFGRWIMLETEQGFGRVGVTILHLEVRTSNLVAINLYGKLGYVITERKTRYYANGEDGFKMVKEVNPALIRY